MATSMVQEVESLRGDDRCRGYRRVPRTALPIHLLRHSCYTMYCLAAMYSVTDRRTDSIMMPISAKNRFTAITKRLHGFISLTVYCKCVLTDRVILIIMVKELTDLEREFARRLIIDCKTVQWRRVWHSQTKSSQIPWRWRSRSASNDEIVSRAELVTPRLGAGLRQTFCPL